MTRSSVNVGLNLATLKSILRLVVDEVGVTVVGVANVHPPKFRMLPPPLTTSIHTLPSGPLAT